MVTDSMSRLVHGYAVPVSRDYRAPEISHCIKYAFKSKGNSLNDVGYELLRGRE